MKNKFKLENNLIYPTRNIKLSSIESRLKSGLSFIPSEKKVYKLFSGRTGKLLESSESGGACILRYIDDARDIMFKNMIIREPIENFVFKFCCKDPCYLEKDKPIIQVIENVDYNFTIDELDVSKLSTFFEINDLGFQKDLNFITKVKLLPNRKYRIKSGVGIHKKGRYLFLSRLLWKYGLVILKSIEVTEPIDNVIFDVYNTEPFDVTLGEDINYSTICSIIKLKE